VRLDIAPHTANVVLKLPDRGIKGVANGDINIFMGMVERSSVPYMHVLPWHGDVDPDMVELTLVVMPMRRLDRHRTTLNPIENALELDGLLADPSFDGLRRIHIPEVDL
jgi:hypothetical protein